MGKAPFWALCQGDEGSFRPPDDDRPVQLTRDEMLGSVEYGIFWHCSADDALMGFGIFEEEQPVALAEVRATPRHPIEGSSTASYAENRGDAVASIQFRAPSESSHTRRMILLR